MLTTPPSDCFGCSACVRVCPAGALSMEVDHEGFSYPSLDADLCIYCNRCNKVCPAQRETISRPASRHCFATWAKDDKLRAQSSSGGIFSLLANDYLRDGNYVCGAIMDGHLVKHTIIKDERDLPALRGSKYVQSDMEACYSDIKRLLARKKQVLFSGTPCQVAGLYGFLGSDHPLLLTVDLLCHGAPSPLAWSSYLHSQIGDKPLRQAQFRHKSLGWEKFSLKLSYGHTVFEQDRYTNPYLVAFLNELSLRPCCHSCPYARDTRQGDITLGDFWGIEAIDAHLSDDKGTSHVSINSEKGQEAFSDIRPQLARYEQIPIDMSKERNPSLIAPAPAHRARAIFYQSINLSKFDFKRDCRFILNGGAQYGIVTRQADDSYGHALTCYALQQELLELGYSSTLIETASNKPSAESSKANTISQFIRSSLHSYSGASAQADYRQNHASFIILGGDTQLLTSAIIANKKLIALSSPPDFPEKELDSRSNGKTRAALSRYDVLSYQDKESAQSAERHVGMKADNNLDPIFLRNEAYWLKLCESCTDELAPDYIAYALLDKTVDLSEWRKSAHDTPIFLNAAEHDSQQSSVERWLKVLYHSAAIITDSFDALCFALIFRKPFMMIEQSQNSRAARLLAECGLENRMQPAIDSETWSWLTRPIDYARVNELLSTQADSLRQQLRISLDGESRNNRMSYSMLLSQELVPEMKKLQFHFWRMKIWKHKLLSYMSWGRKKQQHVAALRKLYNRAPTP